MKLKHLTYIFIILIIPCRSCVEPYEHETDEYQEVLVVEGAITNQPGPYTIHLSRTIPIESNELKKEEGAIVTISDDKGHSEILKETAPGTYTTDSNGIQGVTGNEYVLSIQTADGNSYESEAVTLNPVPEIERIYAEYKEIFSFDQGKMVDGIEINLDTKPWDPEKKYYLKWDYEETWVVFPKWRAKNFDYQPCWNIQYNP